MIFDHYQGYEGEPELTFRTADSAWVVTMWAGFFSNMMRNAVVNTQGQWNTLASHYHALTGWDATSPFELVDPADIVAELQDLQVIGEAKDTLAAYQDLVTVCRFALINNLSIWVDYF